MTPATVIRDALADGVSLTLSVTGTLKATGDESARERWRDTLREHKAGIIDLLTFGEDDRRRCAQCLNLRRGVCEIADPVRGALVVANRGFRPDPTIPRRCEGYSPKGDDTDQRQGIDRWHGLTGPAQ